MTTSFFDDLSIPLVAKDEEVTIRHYPIHNIDVGQGICEWCEWKGSPASRPWFRHVHTEMYRLGFTLSVGMLKQLAYETICNQITDASFGELDPAEMYVDDRLLDAIDEIEDYHIKQFEDQMRYTHNVAISKADLERGVSLLTEYPRPGTEEL